ncbi:unnamed protein product [Phaedon cochleariae]|uniref:DUF4371 domain-containing protein n=1 Tax=Phaedon cochleariae TaxID=80249 RepID=A0A9N9SA17_PHACE|nr:unnamed protein product [Phaedon cochleariae]
MDKFVFKIITEQHNENTQSDPVPSTSKVAEPEPISIIEVDEGVDMSTLRRRTKIKTWNQVKKQRTLHVQKKESICPKWREYLKTFHGLIHQHNIYFARCVSQVAKGHKINCGGIGYFMEETIADIKENYFSIIIDETTDIESKKSMVVIVRYRKEGKVTDRLLDLEVHSVTGESLFAAAQKLTKSVEQFARDLYSYLSHSSKRIAHLQECQIFSNEKPHKMLYPSQTRWLSLKAVVEIILKHWNSLRLFFQREALEGNLPSARAILNALNNQEYKIYFLFLSFVLELITKVDIELYSQKPQNYQFV